MQRFIIEMMSILCYSYMCIGIITDSMEEENLSADLNTVIDNIIFRYCEIRKIKELPTVKIEMVEDLYSKCIEKSTISLRKDLENQKERMQNINGTIVYPELRTDTFGILVKRSYVIECSRQENFNWIGTLCHELTHVLDYINAMELACCLKLEDFKYEPFYPMFGYWTEFNARRFGHYILRCYAHEDDLMSSRMLEDLVKQELPYQIMQLSSHFKDGAKKHDVVYFTMQFLGRLKVWKALFPHYFNEVNLCKMLEVNDWIYKMFLYLDKNDTIEKAMATFGEMEKILNLI